MQLHIAERSVQPPSW